MDTQEAEGIDWNSLETTVGSKTEFMKWEEGENTIRVLSNPREGLISWVTPPGATKPRKVSLSAEDVELADRLTAAGFPVKKTWFMIVLDRTPNSSGVALERFKVAEAGVQIVKGIKTYAGMKCWGPVTGYDIVVTKGKKGTNPLYAVTANPHEKLSTELTAKLAAFVEQTDLSRYVKAMPASEIYEIMGWKPEVKVAKKGADKMDFDFK